MDNFSRTQIVRKAVIPTRGGVVAAAHRRAAEVGAAVLEDGGDADAAVAGTKMAYQNGVPIALPDSDEVGRVRFIPRLTTAGFEIRR